MTGPPAEGLRVPYRQTPEELRAWVDATLGSPVRSATTQAGGFSPGVAARLVCADGTRAFCKAVSQTTNADAAAAHRREQRITAALPVDAPVPRLIADYDDGTWVALLLQDIEGTQPQLPWKDTELTRVVGAIDELSRALTPSPVADAVTVADGQAADFTGWRDLAGGGLSADGLDPWATLHLARLADLEPAWAEACTGDALLHLDLRADNLLLGDDRVWVVDWPWACVGQPWIDIASFAPSVAMQGGPAPAILLASSVVGRSADRDDLTAWVCGLTGFFVAQSLRPPPPGLPTVRAFQAAQGAVGLSWLRELTGWT